jgi:hypothetical protein
MIGDVLKQLYNQPYYLHIFSSLSQIVFFITSLSFFTLYVKFIIHYTVFDIIIPILKVTVIVCNVISILSCMILASVIIVIYIFKMKTRSHKYILFIYLFIFVFITCIVNIIPLGLVIYCIITYKFMELIKTINEREYIICQQKNKSKIFDT